MCGGVVLSVMSGRRLWQPEPLKIPDAVLHRQARSGRLQ